MTKAVRGIYAAAISPFQADGALDVQKLVSYCQYLMSDGGCDGVAPTGTTGEGNSIALNDKLLLPEAFSKAGIANDRVIFGTGACATRDAITLSKNACEHGFHNVLVLPPFYYKNPTDEGLYTYFAQLIDGVGRDDLRVYLYHFPQMSAVPFSTDLVDFEAVKDARAMASKYPLMAAMKQIEAWRSGDESWLKMSPPLVALSKEQRESLRADLKQLSG